ncbi:MAG: SDR family NAD(P)-dependent oxidoreductase [Pseudomonadota bacterium]
MQIGADTPAIVTGAASGLGEATARALAARGAKVTIFDMDAARGEAVASDIGGLFAETNVTSDESVEAAIAKAVAAHGAPRIVVNCAGVGSPGKTIGRDGPIDMGHYEQVIQINLIGTMRVMSKAAWAMSQAEPADADGARGVIVNTASVAAFDGQIGQAAYASSKGGVAGLTLPAARDLSRNGIRVMTIAPGIFGTPMLRGLPEDVQDSLAQQVPFPVRLGDPDEFGKLVCFIAETGYMNGEVIRMDGAIRMGPK